MFTMLSINKQTGKATRVFIGWGDAKFRTEKAALRNIRAYEKMDKEYGCVRDSYYIAYPIRTCAAFAYQEYNAEHNL